MMNDPRLLRQVELHPYPLLFATISGRTCTASRRRIPISTCVACICSRSRKWSG